MPTIDHSLHIRTTSAAFVMSVPEHWHLNNLNGTGAKGMALHVVTSPNGTGVPIMTVTIMAASLSTAATTDTVIAQRAGLLKNASYVIPFFTNMRSVVFDFAATSTSTAQFSIIRADVVENVGLDWTRGVEFR